MIFAQLTGVSAYVLLGAIITSSTFPNYRFSIYSISFGVCLAYACASLLGATFINMFFLISFQLAAIVSFPSFFVAMSIVAIKVCYNPARGEALSIIGFGLYLTGIVFQAFKVGINAWWDHNVLFHIFVLIGSPILFLGIQEILDKDRGVMITE